jgi:hypothetical protein
VCRQEGRLINMKPLQPGDVEDGVKWYPRIIGSRWLARPTGIEPVFPP